MKRALVAGVMLIVGVVLGDTSVVATAPPAAASPAAQSPAAIRTTPVHLATPGLKSPPAWHNRIPWNPRRYFGPFFKGSDFGEIRLRLRREGALWKAEIGFGHYFLLVPQAHREIYARYFAPAPLPFGPPPAYQPSADEMIFHLTSIAYSHHYGGSVKLGFQQGLDTGIEVEGPQSVGPGTGILWDLRDTALDLYCMPKFNVFNAPGADRSLVPEVHLPSTVAAGYRVDSSGRRFLVPDPAPGDVRAVLDSLSEHFVAHQGFSGSLGKFVYGYLHSLHLADFDPDSERVTELLLSDDYVDINTVDKKPMAFVRLKLSDARPPGAHDGDEIRISVRIEYAWNGGGESEGPRREFRVRTAGSTGWFSIAHLRSSEIGYLDHYKVRVAFVVERTLQLDDHGKAAFSIANNVTPQMLESASEADASDHTMANSEQHGREDLVGYQPVFGDASEGSFNWDFKVVAGRR